DDDAEKRREIHRDILPVPPRLPVKPGPHAAPSPRRRTRPIMSRAKMLMTSDISIRTSPSSMSALSSSGSVAFRKLLAIQLAIVCPWSNKEMEIALRFPIVIVTAIVSPTARPRPRMTAPKIPARAYLRTARRVVSQRVAPRLNAASRWLSGTARRASDQEGERGCDQSAVHEPDSPDDQGQHRVPYLAAEEPEAEGPDGLLRRQREDDRDQDEESDHTNRDNRREPLRQRVSQGLRRHGSAEVLGFSERVHSSVTREPFLSYEAFAH